MPSLLLLSPNVDIVLGIRSSISSSSHSTTVEVWVLSVGRSDITEEASLLVDDLLVGKLLINWKIIVEIRRSTVGSFHVVLCLELGVSRLLQVELLILVSHRLILDGTLLEDLGWQRRRNIALVVLSRIKFRLHKFVRLVLQLLVSEIEFLLLDLLLGFELFLLIIVFEVIKKASC